MGGGGGVFFFFKQKTAYEIKECDWSSDVCSSDLVSKSGELTAFINNIELMAQQGDIEEAIKNYRAVFEVLENKLRTLDDSYGIIQDAIRDALDKYIEIGRASCRERV